MFLRNLRKLIVLIPWLGGGGEKASGGNAPIPSQRAGNSPLPLRSGRIEAYIGKHPLFQASKTQEREERMKRRALWRKRRDAFLKGKETRISGVMVS